jgi:hypothetical protein
MGFLDTTRRPLGHDRGGRRGVVSLGAFAAIVPVEGAGISGTAARPRGVSVRDDRLVVPLETGELLEALRRGTPRDGSA